MISIVTGTLNRKHILPAVIENTVASTPLVELVLVDGGSSDGTQEYIKSLKHPQINLIEIDHRSSYPHFMNIGIRNSKFELICQWNDDALLLNKWEEVITYLGEEEIYVFPWRYEQDHEWITYCDFKDTMCMNYGIYKKEVFRRHGLYNNSYKYYYADADMCYRAWIRGATLKILHNIKVVLPENEKKLAYSVPGEIDLYKSLKEKYKNNELPNNIEYLENIS